MSSLWVESSCFLLYLLHFPRFYIEYHFLYKSFADCTHDDRNFSKILKRQFSFSFQLLITDSYTAWDTLLSLLGLTNTFLLLRTHDKHHFLLEVTSDHSHLLSSKEVSSRQLPWHHLYENRVCIPLFNNIFLLYRPTAE